MRNSVVSSPASLSFQNLQDKEIQIGMRGMGAWRDSDFVERLWRAVKYEYAYSHTYDSTGEVKSKIAHYFDFYSRRRPHSRLDRQTRGRVCLGSLRSGGAA